MNTDPQVLIPFTAAESLSIAETAAAFRWSGENIRAWCLKFHLGRKIGGEWKVSRVAFRMFIEGDERSLQSYLQGDRSSPEIILYFQREGISEVLRSPEFTAVIVRQANSKNFKTSKISKTVRAGGGCA